MQPLHLQRTALLAVVAAASLVQLGTTCRVARVERRPLARVQVVHGPGVRQSGQLARERDAMKQVGGRAIVVVVEVKNCLFSCHPVVTVLRLKR